MHKQHPVSLNDVLLWDTFNKTIIPRETSRTTKRKLNKSHHNKKLFKVSWRCLVFFTFIFRTKGRHTFHITWWTHGMQIKIFIFDVHILRKSYIYIWFVIFVLQIGLGALIGFVAALCVFWIHKGLNKISFFLL